MTILAHATIHLKSGELKWFSSESEAEKFIYTEPEGDGWFTHPEANIVKG